MIYPEIWQAFTEQPMTLGADRREYPEWHKNRSRYYLWAVDTDTLLVNRRLQMFRALLRPYLVEPYVRQAHITLAVCGFLADHPVHNDDITIGMIEQQVQRLQALALPPFGLGIGGISSFASAPFLEVADKSQSLERIRAALALAHDDFRTTHYVPHVTIGIYNDAHPVAPLQALLQGQGVEPVDLTVNSIGLYSYAATDIGSALRLERRVELG